MITFLGAAWATVLAIAPSILLGLLLAGLFHVAVSRRRVMAWLGRPGPLSSVRAAVVGVPLPLCSCGVIPAAAGLRRDGASKGAVTSFLISTPQTGVDSIAVTWGVLGWPVALAKVVAAFLAGVIGGTLVDRGEPAIEPGTHPDSVGGRRAGGALRRLWSHSFGTLLGDIYGWLAFGVLVSALITVLVPPDSLAGYELLRGPLGLLAALVIGIPLYVCSVASVPIAAGLIYAGLPVGSALVFLMAGPATNAATMGMVRRTLGTRVFLVYMLTVIGISLAAGGLLNGLDVRGTVPEEMVHGAGRTSVLELVSALLLLAGMAWLAFSRLRRAIGGRASGSCPGGTAALSVSGMTCSGCEGRVEAAARSFPGVTSARASAEAGRLELRLDGEVDLESLAERITGAGYAAEVEGGGCDDACGF